MGQVISKNWMERWDVAQMLQSKLDVSAWKGDEHTNGVFFDDTHGVVLNKVLAIRVKHDEEGVSDLFYSFNAQVPEDGSSEVLDGFPFRSMKVRPKKHFLLFDAESLHKPDLPKIFEGDYAEGVVSASPQEICAILEKVSNKRERERAIATLHVEKDKLVVTVHKSTPKSKRTILSEGAVSCIVKQEPSPEKKIFGSVNAHTLSYILGIFNPTSFSSVTFSFGHDRIMITGDNTFQNPNVEVVVSRLKTA